MYYLLYYYLYWWWDLRKHPIGLWKHHAFLLSIPRIFLRAVGESSFLSYYSRLKLFLMLSVRASWIKYDGKWGAHAVRLASDSSTVVLVMFTILFSLSCYQTVCIDYIFSFFWVFWFTFFHIISRIYCFRTMRNQDPLHIQCLAVCKICRFGWKRLCATMMGS